jgi:hypothetical protein
MNVRELIATNGGGTFAAENLQPITPQHGYAVGVEFGTAITLEAGAGEMEIMQALETVAHGYAHRGARAVGAWMDGERIHIDPVLITPTLHDALRVAREYGQVAVYNFSTGNTVEVAS